MFVYPILGLHPVSVLRYNDMNLVDGGVFDLSGTWGVPVPPDDPLGSHLLHSCGTDTDVGIRDTNGHPINEADLSNLIIHNYPGALMIH